MSESLLREKLRKIEALFAGTGFAGEASAAKAAAERIRAKLKEIVGREAAIEFRFSVPDPWSRQLFVALCRRYGLNPYRYPRMQRQTVIVRVPRSFVEATLRPEFDQLNAALSEYLSAATERIIKEEVFGDTTDAEEVDTKSLPPPR
jgi:hypothetical protein